MATQGAGPGRCPGRECAAQKSGRRERPVWLKQIWEGDMKERQTAGSHEDYISDHTSGLSKQRLKNIHGDSLLLNYLC